MKGSSRPSSISSPRSGVEAAAAAEAEAEAAGAEDAAGETLVRALVRAIGEFGLGGLKLVLVREQGVGFWLWWKVGVNTRTCIRFSLPAVVILSRCRLRGTQETLVYTTAQVWAPTGLREACSRRSKSHELTLFHGIALRDAEWPRTMESPQFKSIALLLLYHNIPPTLELSILR